MDEILSTCETIAYERFPPFWRGFAFSCALIRGMITWKRLISQSEITGKDREEKGWLTFEVELRRPRGGAVVAVACRQAEMRGCPGEAQAAIGAVSREGEQAYAAPDIGFNVVDTCVVG